MLFNPNQLKPPVKMYLWVEKSNGKARQQQVVVIKIHKVGKHKYRVFGKPRDMHTIECSCSELWKFCNAYIFESLTGVL